MIARLAAILIQALPGAPYHHVPEPPPLPGTEWVIGRSMADLRARIPSSWRIAETADIVDIDLPDCRMTVFVDTAKGRRIVRDVLPVTRDDGPLAPAAQAACIATFAQAR